MIVETSALVAIFLNEPEKPEFLEKISKASKKQISSVSVAETACVLYTKKGFSASHIIEFLKKAKIEIVPFDAIQLKSYQYCLENFYHKKNGLNFGDCFAYSLAKTTESQLLYKGNDFSQTDIVSA